MSLLRTSHCYVQAINDLPENYQNFFLLHPLHAAFRLLAHLIHVMQYHTSEQLKASLF